MDTRLAIAYFAVWEFREGRIQGAVWRPHRESWEENQFEIVLKASVCWKGARELCTLVHYIFITNWPPLMFQNQVQQMLVFQLEGCEAK